VQSKPVEAASQYEDNEFVYYLKDKSSNGTYVDGRRVGKGNRTILRNNAKIELTQKNKNSMLTYL
jgi:pSer/pThr/pTyr-binding forkhead associated (FHA) protein